MTSIRPTEPGRSIPPVWLALPVLLVFSATRLACDSDSNHLRVHFIDVGQGDAIWIQGPAEPGRTAGLNVIIDGGPDTGRDNRLPAYLAGSGLKPGQVIDYVISTHPHDDHYPGLLDILEQYQVRTIVDPGFPKEGKGFKKFVAAAKSETANGKQSEFVELRKHQNLKLDWGKLEARILYADRGDLKGMGSKNTRENNASTVLRLAFGKFTFLFMGDAEGKGRAQPPDKARYVERLLLDTLKPEELRATVLKAGHHGSETGSTLPFIRAVRPDVVVIMSGRKVFRGTFLPDASVIQRYTRELPDATILRTDDKDQEEGRNERDDADGDDVFMDTDGETLSVFKAELREGQRRWERVKVIH